MEEIATQTTEETVQATPAPRELKNGEYIEGIGRRKRAVARVRIFGVSADQSALKDGFSVNGMPAREFFARPGDQEKALEPLTKLKLADSFRVTVWLRGGGITGQAEAVRLGLARALLIYDPLLKSRLRTEGFLTRDPREKERRKYGLKKARRAPQFSKR